MKKLIIILLLTFLIATTFVSDNPPGWYQQTLPVTNTVSDISFVDSLRGWAITERNGGDAYILHTSDGGNSWSIQLQQVLLLAAIQFLDNNTGYVVGSSPPGIVLKTTNGGSNWFNISNLPAYPLLDVKFVNKDTGWVCSDDSFDGGVFKTTNGGNNWIRQTTPSQILPIKLFFLNSDTGWALSGGSGGHISKTINGGTNWSFLNNTSGIERDLFFLNNDTGWVISGGSGQNGITKTTDGGANWFVQLDPTPFGSAPNSIYSYSNSKSWIAALRFTILSLANDSTWGKQSVPSGFPSFNAIQMTHTNIGYSGGSIFVKTDDGGGLITGIENNVETISGSFTLYQNYPNPFNPVTKINYELRVTNYVSIIVYDILGNKVSSLINYKQIAGSYEIEFDGSNLPSGVYFYRMEVSDGKTDKLLVQTKKMLLIR